MAESSEEDADSDPAELKVQEGLSENVDYRNKEQLYDKKTSYTMIQHSPRSRHNFEKHDHQTEITFPK